MWLKRSQKLSSISRSTKISLSTSTHPHHFMEHLITPGRTALKVVSWWEFSYCSSWLKVGSLKWSDLWSHPWFRCALWPGQLLWVSYFVQHIPYFLTPSHVIDTFSWHFQAQNSYGNKVCYASFCLWGIWDRERQFKHPALCNHSTLSLRATSLSPARFLALWKIGRNRRQ